LGALPNNFKIPVNDYSFLKERMMKKIIVSVLVVLVVAGVSSAAQNVPNGVTGLWRFQTDAEKMKATFGIDMGQSLPSDNAWMLGPWTDIGTEDWHTRYSDGGVVAEQSWEYLQVNPNFTANGGGDYVNQYTVAIDYCQTSGLTSWNSLFQTSWGGQDSDGDLFTDGAGHIGIGAVGYSTLTYDASTWHRIVWSIDTTSFFDVYVDGVQFLHGGATGLDGRFSLYTDRFNLFADNDWEDQWGLVGTVATWGRALTAAEVAGMGGWIGGAATPTPLIIPEPATMTLVALGGLALLRRNRK
jgi:hypothetical protein